jgi:hypothetical protein
MTRIQSAAVGAVLAATTLAGVAVASENGGDRPIETYYASLSNWDHIDGMGHRLTSVSDILRQDRANFHNRHLRDPSDVGDRYFRREENRRRIPGLVANGMMDSETTQRILRAEPRVRVDRYADRLEVTIETNGGVAGPLGDRN